MKRSIGLVIGLALLVGACSAGPGGASATAGTSSTPAGGASAGASGAAAGSAVDAIKAKGKLVCGTKFDVRSFGFKNPTNNQVEGLDADLCREIAKALGVEAETVEAVSANRIPFLLEDKVDVVISTMTATEERKKEIDFSHIYYVAGQSLLVKEDSDIATVDDLNGKTVCSGEGSTSEENIREMAPEAELLLFKTYTEAGQALADGRCEVVSTDNTILFGLAEQFPGTKLVGEPFTEEPLGIGVKKDKDDLVEAINAELEAMKADGRLTALYEKWIKPFTGETPEAPF